MHLAPEVIGEIDVLVRSAFWDSATIKVMICEELYSPGKLDEDAVTSAIEAHFNAWREEQSNWPTVTDCDRLDTAFWKLNKRGVVALHNAGMDQSDGYDQFKDVWLTHPDQASIIGYCFYHGQDLQRVVVGEPLYLGFGPTDPQLEEAEGSKVGRIIAEELAHAGLQVDWNGKFGTRIRILNLKWQRRKPPELGQG